MSTREIEPLIQQSVLDRLIDEEPRSAADPVVTRRDSVLRLESSVMRDLEWLLNTRRIARPAPASFHELRASVYHFGLADLTSLSRDSDETVQRLGREIEECIRLFEPRLAAVRVTPRTREGAAPQRIRFGIDALLRMEPEPERILFDTVLDVGRAEFLVSVDDA